MRGLDDWCVGRHEEKPIASSLMKRSYKALGLSVAADVGADSSAGGASPGGLVSRRVARLPAFKPRFQTLHSERVSRRVAFDTPMIFSNPCGEDLRSALMGVGNKMSKLLEGLVLSDKADGS